MIRFVSDREADLWCEVYAYALDRREFDDMAPALVADEAVLAHRCRVAASERKRPSLLARLWAWCRRRA